MKALKLMIVVMMFVVAGATQAQVNVSLHLGSPPAWGPAGYSDVQYYYLPDVHAYYDINASMFIYQSGGVWVHRSYLPRQYRNYDLYGGYKVVLNDYHGNRPYANYREHRRDYSRGYHGQPQHNIGERPANGNRNGHMEQQRRSYRQPAHNNVRSEGRGNSHNQGRGNDKNEGRGNDKNSKKGNDHGGDNGKRK